MSGMLTSRYDLIVSAERTYYREVGRKIRAARRSADLTQQDLADEVDLARTSITNIESGNQPVSLWLLNMIATVVHRDAVDLLPTTTEVDHSGLPGDVPAKTAAFIRSLDVPR